MSIGKDFSSLKKHRHGGVLPRNLLTGPTQKIEIPTASSLNSGTVFVVKLPDLAEKFRSQDIRTCFFLPLAIIDNGLNEPPVLSIDVASIEYNGSKIVSTGERELLLNLSKNGRFLFFTRNKAFIDKMVIPRDALRHVWATSDDRNMLFVLQKKFGLIYVNFATKSSHLRLFFQKHASAWITGRFLVLDTTQVAGIYNQRLKKRENSTRDPTTVVSLASLPEASQVISDADAGEDSSFLGASDDVLLNGIPFDLSSKKPKRPQTRALSKMADKEPELITTNSDKSMDHEDEEDDDDEDDNSNDVLAIQEAPAPFDPPLRYTLTNGKKFIVAYNDFKTLYNNDWINDTLIDFFIAYDIDRAENKLHLIHGNEVYAFNSFFFTKLMSKAPGQETPDYYGNIRRWIAKIDLMSHKYVIIPVNEHLHWFCVIMKGLPELVEAATEYHKGPKSGELSKLKRKNNKVEPVVDMYILDSLRQSHSDITIPLKTLIDEYCKDKYNVAVPGELIRIRSARVPKQRNFNDCGVHVIYNVRKWLDDPDECEKVWRKFKKQQRSYFRASERNNMRQASIDFLLQLHKEQVPENSPSAEEDEGDHSDDEIELISYHSSKPPEDESEVEKTGNTEAGEAELERDGALEQPKEHENTTPKSKQNTPIEPENDSSAQDLSAAISTSTELQTAKASQDISIAKSRSGTPVRTLDPRVLEATSSPKASPRTNEIVLSNNSAVKAEVSPVAKGHERLISNPSYQIEHPHVRRFCMNTHLKPHTIDFLNGYFVNHSKKYDSFQQKIIEFVKKYNFFDPDTEKDQCELLQQNFKEQFHEPPAPLDEPFVIQEADDSNGELNQSVSDLRILKEGRRQSRSRATPEATRRFMREADQLSPVRSQRSAANSSIGAMFSSASPSRHTRSSDHQEDEDSDLEVLGDETLRIVSAEEKSRLNSPRMTSKMFAHSPESDKRRRNRSILAGPDRTSSQRITSRTIVSIPDEDNTVKSTKISRNKSATSADFSISAKGLPTGSKRRRVDSKVVIRRAYK